jgi:hypothetical protein
MHNDASRTCQKSQAKINHHRQTGHHKNWDGQYVNNSCHHYDFHKAIALPQIDKKELPLINK